MPGRKPIVRLLLAAAALWFGLEAFPVVAGKNLHTVFEGRVYRSAQLTPEQIEDLVAERGIRTIVNLRGFCPTFDWYTDECRAAQELGLNHEDVTLSASRLPPPGELRRLIEVFDHGEYPMLLHCRRGADRTGIASAIMTLLYSDGGLDAAHWQCGPRYGHLGIGPASAMGRFLGMYESFLAEEGIAHSPDVFRSWVLEAYSPGVGRAEMTLSNGPASVRVGDPLSLTLHAVNRSNEVWHLKPGTGSGVHARYLVCDPAGGLIHQGKAGLFDAEVPPGGAIDLAIAVPPFAVPGEYVLYIEMIAGDGTAFSQLGSPAVYRELAVMPNDQ